MKKLMITLVALCGSVAFVSAQETAEPTAPASEAVAPNADAAPDAERAQLKAEELPAAIKQTLADQEYKGWLINTAYHDKKNERYEVELKNGADTNVIKFNQEGQRLDD